MDTRLLADTIPWYSASAELRLTLLCVRLTVAIVFPAYPSTIPVVLCLVFTQPPQPLSLVAVSSLPQTSLALGSNFQMLVRLFTRGNA